jgi:hypothetical protein
MHGSIEKGVEMGASGEFVPWATLVQKLRLINVATGNNLLVVAAACFGLHAIRQTTITQAAPFFMLIAPEQEVSIGFLEGHIFPFFQQMLSTGDAMAAYRNNLAPKMKMFHCMQVFTVAMAKYISRYCKGKTAEDRREKLLTEVLLDGRKRTKANLKEIRKAIKRGIKPDQRMLDKFAGTFLIGRPFGLDMDALLELIESAKVGLQQKRPARREARP